MPAFSGDKDNNAYVHLFWDILQGHPITIMLAAAIYQSESLESLYYWVC